MTGCGSPAIERICVHVLILPLSVIFGVKTMNGMIHVWFRINNSVLHLFIICATIVNFIQEKMNAIVNSEVNTLLGMILSRQSLSDFRNLIGMSQ